jgi:hypothetical protein
MAFLTPLDLRAYKPDEWVLLLALIYMAKDGKRYIVPRGFITDLASIPRLLRALFDINGQSRAPAVLHDFLYCMHYTTRAEADALFLEALEAAGVGWATRWSMYLGVRSGGWIYWSKRDDGITQEDFLDDDDFEADQG